MNRRPNIVVFVEIGDGESPITVESRVYGWRRLRCIAKRLAKQYGYRNFCISGYAERHPNNWRGPLDPPGMGKGIWKRVAFPAAAGVAR